MSPTGAVWGVVDPDLKVKGKDISKQFKKSSANASTLQERLACGVSTLALSRLSLQRIPKVWPRQNSPPASDHHLRPCLSGRRACRCSYPCQCDKMGASVVGLGRIERRRSRVSSSFQSSLGNDCVHGSLYNPMCFFVTALVIVSRRRDLRAVECLANIQSEVHFSGCVALVMPPPFPPLQLGALTVQVQRSACTG
jgi:hypothetical protein